jgi:hypothetical protein
MNFKPTFPFGEEEEVITYSTLFKMLCMNYISFSDVIILIF